MPVSLAKIAANVASVSFSYEGDSITIAYYPGRITAKVLIDLQASRTRAQEDIQDGMTLLTVTLCSIMKSWDVYEDVEQTVMLPLEPERMEELPLPFINAVGGAIMGDMTGEVTAPQTATS
jgi:hypothetical protein